MKNLQSRTNDAIDFTRYITEKWNERLAGSKMCLETADYLHDQFSLFSDNQFKQEFKINPGGFLGFIRVCTALFFINIICVFAHFYYISLGIALLSLLITVCEFFFYFEILEPFFPQKKGKNIYAFLEPEEEVKQQVIISAHHDSAHIFNFYEHSPNNYYIKIYLGLGSLLVSILISVILFFIPTSLVAIVLKYIMLVSSVFVYPLWNFIDTKRGTPGAGDNIICTAVTFEILKYFHQLKKDGKGLKNTRVIIGSWDAEEAGLRGAKAFVKANKDMLHSIPSYNYNLECLYDYGSLNVLTTDINSFVKLNEEMADDCIEVGTKLGYKVQKAKFPILAGGTDAGEFARGGIKAVTLNGMNLGDLLVSPSYHTTRDTVDKVDPKAVCAAIDIGIEYIVQKDRQII